MSQSASPHACNSSSKGKARARSKTPEPTERTPLLSSGPPSTITITDDNGIRAPAPAHRRLYRRLVVTFVATLTVCIVLVLIVLLIAYSYTSRASNISTKDILDRGLVVEGPNRIDVLNITETGGIWVQVEGRVGVDAGELIGINSSDDDLVWKALWKGLGRWGVKRLGVVTVDVSNIELNPQVERSTVLATLRTPPLQLELTTDPPKDNTWLETVSLPVLLMPTNETSTLVRFARDSWSVGVLSIAASVSSVVVTGGRPTEGSWRNKLHLEKSNVETEIRVRIPPLAGLPNPGRQTPFPPFTELITLKSFNLFSELEQVLITASATFIDPAPTSLAFTAPSLPFIISIPSTDEGTANELIPIASVNTSAFSLTHPNVTLDISGHVLSLSPESSPALSSFVKSYLSMRSPDISISSPIFPGITLDTVFPAPNPRPEVLRNVTIKDMKIKPSSSGSMLASGLVFATAVLPKGMNVAVDVSRVFPELLVFDGAVPPETEGNAYEERDGEDEMPEPMPIPDPLPDRAFAHIRPDEWLDALSIPIESPEDGGSAVAVSAKLVDVPLQVLPGRQRQFSSFVSKVIFGTDGALAGVSGQAAVTVHVQGLPIGGGDGWGQMDLHGLPFQGEVRVGKKGVV